MGRVKGTKAGVTEGEDTAQAEKGNPDDNAVLRNLDSKLDTHTEQFEKILTAIRDTKCALEAKIDTVAVDVGLLREDHKKLAARVSEVESTHSTVRPSVQQLQKEVRNITTDIETLRRRAEEAEGHSRRSNIRFMGSRKERRAAMLTSFWKIGRYLRYWKITLQNFSRWSAHIVHRENLHQLVLQPALL